MALRKILTICVEIPNQIIANTCYQIKTIFLRLTASLCCYKFVAHTLPETVYRSTPLWWDGTNKHTDQIYNFMKNDSREQLRRIQENKLTMKDQRAFEQLLPLGNCSWVDLAEQVVHYISSWFPCWWDLL